MVLHCLPERYQVWIDARKRFCLSHIHIQMARELGLNPKKFGKLDNHHQGPWKASLQQFIEHLYFKRFGRERPDRVASIEEIAKQHKLKKQKVQQEQAVPALGPTERGADQ